MLHTTVSAPSATRRPKAAAYRQGRRSDRSPPIKLWQPPLPACFNTLLRRYRGDRYDHAYGDVSLEFFLNSILKCDLEKASASVRDGR